MVGNLHKGQSELCAGMPASSKLLTYNGISDRVVRDWSFKMLVVGPC